MNAPIAGWAGISAFLLEAASRDLSSIGGAFGFSTSEWTVVCFISGIAFAVCGVLHVSLQAAAPTSPPISTRER